MKILIQAVLAIVLFAVLANDSYAQANKRQNREKSENVESEKDSSDIFPWPWGTECPFPWKTIKGSWEVVGGSRLLYTGHRLEFTIKKEASGIAFLEISHYDKRGRLRATGTGFAEEGNHIVKGVMTMESSGKNYVVLVRSYAQENRTCRAVDRVVAVTFCTARDTNKKCTENSNFVLERLEEEDMGSRRIR